MKNNIQQLRKAMQLSQEDLAAKAGVSRQIWRLTPALAAKSS